MNRGLVTIVLPQITVRSEFAVLQRHQLDPGQTQRYHHGPTDLSVGVSSWWL